MSKTATKGKAKTLGIKVESVRNLSNADAANVKGGAGIMPTGHTTAPTVGDIRGSVFGGPSALPGVNVAPVKP